MYFKQVLFIYYIFYFEFIFASNWFNFGSTQSDIKAMGCSSEESTLTAKYFHHYKFDQTNCPTETWLSDFHLVDSNPNKLIIDVG